MMLSPILEIRGVSSEPDWIWRLHWGASVPLLITSLKQQAEKRFVLWRRQSDSQYNNKIQQTSGNPVTFAELNHFVLLSASLSMSASLFVALFWTRGFEQLGVSWLCTSNHSHVYCFSRIRESASDSLSQQKYVHCNIPTHSVHQYCP